MTILTSQKSPHETHPEPFRNRLAKLVSTLSREFDTPFRIYSSSTGRMIDVAHDLDSPHPPGRETAAAILAALGDRQCHVVPSRFDRYRLVLPFPDHSGALLIAIAELPALACSSEDFRREQTRLLKWVQAVHRPILDQWNHSLHDRASNMEEDRFALTLRTVLEVGDLLRSADSSRHGGKTPSEILQRASQLVPSETVLWIPASSEEPVIIDGKSRVSSTDVRELAALLLRHPDWDTSECLILNNLHATLLEARFPHFVNLMAVSNSPGHDAGILIAINKFNGSRSDHHPVETDPDTSSTLHLTAIAPFRRLDSALLVPFAALLGGQSRRFRRQRQIQDLFTGLTRSLVAAIDAKDPYTCGHSERVGRIAVEIGREMGLQELELSDLYLGGLLHDIGKIGVPDSILAKREPLTPWEFDQIRQHVIIGFRILADFRAISHLLPQVLYHHERVDGTGYPEGLLGDQIPLSARILAVADGYDAMSSARPYRDALTRQAVEDALDHGRNFQWDAKVVEAFFRSRERIYAIQRKGVGNSICFSLENAFRTTRSTCQNVRTETARASVVA